jgi:hypothetical protein
MRLNLIKNTFEILDLENYRLFRSEPFQNEWKNIYKKKFSFKSISGITFLFDNLATSHFWEKFHHVAHPQVLPVSYLYDLKGPSL